MRHRLPLFALALICALVPPLAAVLSAAPLHQATIYAGPELCANRNADANGFWVNTTGHPLRIKIVRFWQGADFNLVADLGMALYTVDERGVQMLHSQPFDRYAVPQNDRDTWLAASDGDWFPLGVGGYLSLHRSCYTWLPLGEGRQNHAQSVSFWYTVEDHQP